MSSDSPAARKGGLRRFLAIVFLGLVLALGGIIFALDTLVRLAVEREGSAALGVPIKTGSASLGLLTGSVGLRDVVVANPEGFEGDFLRLGAIRLEIPPRALLDDEIVAQTLTLDDIEIRLERVGIRTNYGAILENLSGPENPAPAPPGSAKRFRIEQTSLRDVRAEVHLLSELGKAGSLVIQIPEIQLANLGGDSSGGVLLRDVVGRVVTTLLSSLASRSVGLPAALQAHMKSSLVSLARVAFEIPDPAIVVERGKAVLALPSTVVREGAKAAGEVLEGAGDAAKGILDGVGSLVGAKSDEDGD